MHRKKIVISVRVVPRNSKLDIEIHFETNSEVLRNSLPPKHEHVVFCKMTETQIQSLQQTTSRFDLLKAMRSQALSLPLITKLKKICNHPSLGDRNKDVVRRRNKVTKEFFQLSGKIHFLQIFLKQLRTSTDRVVFVSNYTQTLDLLENLCTMNKYPFLRLDGSTKTSSRQELVNRFNDPRSDSFVFLSSKAGGCGLNLIGGNHLFLSIPIGIPQLMSRPWHVFGETVSSRRHLSIDSSVRVRIVVFECEFHFYVTRTQHSNTTLEYFTGTIEEDGPKTNRKG